SSSGDLPTSAGASTVAMTQKHVEIAGAEIEINFEPGRLQVTEKEVVDWVSSSARAVAAYFGRFPLRNLTVVIRPSGGKGVHYGNAVGYGKGSATITTYVGAASNKGDLDEDWVMAHEMIHLGFPSLPDGYSWMEE